MEKSSPTELLNNKNCIGILRGKMKNKRVVVLIVILTVFTVTTVSPFCQAIKTIEIESMHFEKKSVAQGETDSLLFNITNYLGNTAIINYLGIHFDWQNSGEFYEENSVKSNPINLPPSSTVSSQVSFTVPNNAPVGTHDYLFSCRFDFQGGGGGTVNVTGHNFEVKQGTSGGGDQNPNSAVGLAMGIIVYLIMIILAIVLCIFVIKYRRRIKELEKQIKEQETPMKYAQYQPPPPQPQIIQPVMVIPPYVSSQPSPVPPPMPVPPPEPQSEQSEQIPTTIGASEKINNCPFCGKKLNLKKSPQFCPYCNEKFE